MTCLTGHGIWPILKWNLGFVFNIWHLWLPFRGGMRGVEGSENVESIKTNCFCLNKNPQSKRESIYSLHFHY